jgi:hypothetical protein
MKKWNTINSVPLNPNVTLAEKRLLKRPLFQNDDLLLTTVTSKNFQDLLLIQTQQNRKVKTLLQNI